MRNFLIWVLSCWTIQLILAHPAHDFSILFHCFFRMACSTFSHFIRLRFSVQAELKCTCKQFESFFTSPFISPNLSPFIPQQSSLRNFSFIHNCLLLFSIRWKLILNVRWWLISPLYRERVQDILKPQTSVVLVTWFIHSLVERFGQQKMLHRLNRSLPGSTFSTPLQ